MKNHGHGGRRGGRDQQGGKSRDQRGGGGSRGQGGGGGQGRSRDDRDRGRDRDQRGRDERSHGRRDDRRDHHHNNEQAPRGRATLWGAHAVREAWLNPARTIRALYVTEETRESFADAIELAISRGLDRPAPTVTDRRALDRMTATGAVHQGLALDAAPLEEVYIQDLINSAAGKKRAVIVMLDQVTDPHNVGAIMRSACAFGAIGIVMQKRHAPELDGVLVKTASGAAEHIPVAYETNLSRTLEQLQEEGFFALALDERGDVSLEELPAYERAVIVMGAEGPGIRRLVKEHCDRLVRLPTGGPVGVLNVSNATAVALYALTTAK